MEKMTNKSLKSVLFLALFLLAGCGNKKSDYYNPDKMEVANIYFPKSGVRLDDNDKQALDELARDYKEHQAKTKEPLVVMLTAHTSKEGNLASNVKVAAKRAAAVAEYLRKTHNVEVVVHALPDPRAGEGAAARLVVARICAKKACDAVCTAEHVKKAHKKAKKKAAKAAEAKTAAAATVTEARHSAEAA